MTVSVAAGAAHELWAAAQAALGPAGALLPRTVPRCQLPGSWERYLELSRALPDHYPARRGGVRRWLDVALGEDPGTTSTLDDEDATALLVALCALGHTYRWDSVPPAPERFLERHLTLPSGLRAPWEELARRFDVPRVGSAWTLHLCNWRRRAPRDTNGAYTAAQLQAADLVLAHQWLDEPAASDLEAFSLTFVLMEARAGAAVAAAVDAVRGAVQRDQHRVAEALAAVAAGMRDAAQQFVVAIRDGSVDPERWLELVQPTMPWGLADQQGVTPPGPNGLQLPSWQLFDALLAVPAQTPLALQAREARLGMPRPHRALLTAADDCRDVIRSFVTEAGTSVTRRRYEEALDGLRRFRTAHRVRASRYLRAGRQGESPRQSTGLGLEWRPDDDADPVRHFEALADARVGEVSLASLAGPHRRGTDGRESLSLLSPQEVERLLALGSPQQVRAGVQVLRTGDSASGLWYVVDGVLAVETHPTDDTTVTVDELWPGELFGEMSYLTGLPVSAWVRAVTDVQLVALQPHDIEQGLGDDPVLLARFFQSLAVSLALRLRESAARVTDLQARLAHPRQGRR